MTGEAERPLGLGRLRLLCSMRNFRYVKLFVSVIRELAAGGHHVHILAERGASIVGLDASALIEGGIAGRRRIHALLLPGVGDESAYRHCPTRPFTISR